MLGYTRKKNKINIKREKGIANLEYIVGISAGVVFAALAAINYLYQNNESAAYINTGVSIGGFLVAYLSKRKMKKLEEIVEYST